MIQQLTGRRRRLRGRGRERSRIIRPQESLVLHKSFSFLRDGVTGLLTEQNNKTPEPGAPLLATSPGWTPPNHLTPFASSPLDFDRQPTTEVRIPYILLQHSHSLYHANNATKIVAFCSYVFSKESSFKIQLFCGFCYTVFL